MWVLLVVGLGVPGACCGRRFLGHVAMGDLPFVVLFGEHRTYRPAPPRASALPNQPPAGRADGRSDMPASFKRTMTAFVRCGTSSRRSMPIEIRSR